MSNQEWPKFWLETNQRWGWVRSREEWEEMVNDTIQPNLWGFRTREEILEYFLTSRQHRDGIANFGQYTYAEHTGEKTLREFLAEHGIEP